MGTCLAYACKKHPFFTVLTMRWVALFPMEAGGAILSTCVFAQMYKQGDMCKQLTVQAWLVRPSQCELHEAVCLQAAAVHAGRR